MAIEMRRTHLGKYPNEGARQAWAAMERLGFDQASFRAAVLEQTGRELSSGALVKILYCERRPGLVWADVFRVVLGVDPTNWHREPRDKFNLPATRVEGSAA